MFKKLSTALAFILLGLQCNTSLAEAPLVVLHTKEGLVDALTTRTDLGPISYAHKLLFEQ